MKKNNITSVLGVIGLAGLVGVGSLSAQDATPPAPPVAPPAIPPAPPAPKLTDAEVKDISSYVLGLQSAQRFAGSGLTAEDLDNAALLKGFHAGLKGDKPEYPEAKLRAAMEALGKAVQGREAKKSEVTLAAGNAFLAENAKRPGVKTTASGMQYEVIKKGTGKKYVAPVGGEPQPQRAGPGQPPQPPQGTTFMVHYRGTLIDGTEFDKSPDGQTFPMTLQVIPGFKEALTMMPVGSKWKIFLPSKLAYGPRAAGPKIAANSALIFELELVEIKAAPATVAPPLVPIVPAPPRPRASAVTPPVQVPAPAPAKKAEKAE